MDAQEMEEIRLEIKAEYQRFSEAGRPRDFPALPPMPVARYADEAFYQLEREYLWKRSWLLAGHIGELPDIGDYKLWDDLDIPIILVRGKDSEIRAFVNACRHRGGPLVYEKSGCVKAFSCKYHNWGYRLNGELGVVPDEHEFPELDKSQLSLQSIRVEIWGTLIFVNFDPDATPLMDYLGPIARSFKNFQMEKRHVYATVSYEMDCNWKVGLDNNSEAYHVIAVHPETVHKMLDYRGNVLHLFTRGHSRVISPRGNRGDFDLLDMHHSSDNPDYALTRETIGSVVITPNVMISYGEFHFPVITYWPVGLNKTKMVVYFTSPFEGEDPRSDACQGVVRGFGIALDEDRAPLAAVQKAYELGLVKDARLGFTERRVYHHHEEIDRMIGPERVPENCKMKFAIPEEAIRC